MYQGDTAAHVPQLEAVTEGREMILPCGFRDPLHGN